MRKIKRKIAAALLISADHKLLMGKKAADSVYPDCWHIPGGGIEPGETPEQALIREVQEEVGLDISQIRPKLIDDQEQGEHEKTLNSGERVLAQMDFVVYKVELEAEADQLQIELNDDLVDYTWADISQLASYQLTPPSEKIFSKFGWI